MRETSKLDWQTPGDEWEQFRQHVNDKFGTIEGYLGREAELAMKQYIDADGYARVEALVDRLVSAAGRTPDGSSQKIKSDLDSQEPTRVQIRIGTQIKEEFCVYVDENTDYNYGVALARALNVYRDGGRSRRVEDKLDRVVDDAESILSHVNPDVQDDMDVQERKTIAICNELNEQFKDETLVKKIDEIASTGDQAAPQTREKYRELVTDRLGYERHPNVSDLWIPEERLREMFPEERPTQTYKTVDKLNDDELLSRLVFEAGRLCKVIDNSRVVLSRDRIRREVYDKQLSKSRVTALMKRAADYHGISSKETADGRKLSLCYSRIKAQNPEIGETIAKYADCDASPLLVEATETTIENYTSVKEGPESVDEVMEPSAVADGGVNEDNDG